MSQEPATQSTAPEPFSNASYDMSWMNDPANEVDRGGTAAAPANGEPSEPEHGGENPPPATPDSDPPAAPEPSEPAGEAPAKVSFAGVKPAVVALMKQYAADHKVTLDDPNIFAIIRQSAEKESLLRDKRTAEPPSGPTKDYLDMFRDPEPKKPEAPAAPAPAAGQGEDAPKPVELPSYVTRGQAWKSPDEMYTAAMDIYEKPESPTKAAEWMELERAKHNRLFFDDQMPVVAHYVNQVLEARLGPMLQQSARARDEETRSQVLSQLKTHEGREDVDSIFEAASEGEIEFPDGSKAPDTWINRALAAVPEIMDIKVEGRNEGEGKRLTTARRYAAIHRVVQSLRAMDGSTPSGENKHAQALAVAIDRSKRDTARTNVNAPSNGSPAPKPASQLSWMHTPNVWDRMYDK